MYKLHIANKNYSSWSLRPWVLMKELSIQFQEVLSPFENDSNLNGFREFSPSGLVPCLIDDDKVIWDSLGITEYLAEMHKGVWPAASNARAWARCAAAEMHSGFSTLRQKCPMNCGLRIRLKEVSPSLQKDTSRIDELWNEGIKKFGGPFLAGFEFTAVDAFFAPVAFRVQTYDLVLSDTGFKYVELLLSINSMRHWKEEALNEKWRESSHENDCLHAGVILEDFRRA